VSIDSLSRSDDLHGRWLDDLASPLVVSVIDCAVSTFAALSEMPGQCALTMANVAAGVRRGQQWRLLGARRIHEEKGLAGHGHAGVLPAALDAGDAGKILVAHHYAATDGKAYARCMTTAKTKLDALVAP
jgi:hypothetical protein